jgi:hypothetical protein
MFANGKRVKVVYNSLGALEPPQVGIVLQSQRSNGRDMVFLKLDDNPWTWWYLESDVRLEYEYENETEVENAENASKDLPAGTP